MLGQAAQQVAPATGIVHMQHRMDAYIWLRARPQDQALDVVKLQLDPVAAEAFAEAGEQGHQ